MRFAIAYWHSFCADGSDQFGTATHVFPWSGIADPVEQAKAKMDSAFDFFVKIGAPYYCFHDVGLIREGQGVAAYEKNGLLVVEREFEGRKAALYINGTSSKIDVPFTPDISASFDGADLLPSGFAIKIS